MYGYGNARIAALRSRLLDAAAFRYLSESDSPSAYLAFLERSEDWRPILLGTASLLSDPQAAIEATIERFRSVRLGALPHWYEPPVRHLVEALVMPLDLERVVAVIRRRDAGAAGESTGSPVAGGALLDVAALGALGRAPDSTAFFVALGRMDLVPTLTARDVAAAIERDPSRRGVEEYVLALFERGRTARVSGRGVDARTVRAILSEESEEREMIAAEVRDGGSDAAWLLERPTHLARLDRLVRRGRRDPLGIGAVAGYVAAVEAQAIRMRACLARVAAGWSAEAVGPFLAGAEG